MTLTSTTTDHDSLTEWGNWQWHNYQPQGGTVTTYASETPSDAPEPATPIEGDQPLPDPDEDNDDEANDGG